MKFHAHDMENFIRIPIQSLKNDQMKIFLHVDET